MISLFIKLKAKVLKNVIMTIILLLHLSNLYLLTIGKSGSMKNLSLSDMLGHPLASEKKQALTVKTLGVFSESISSKKYNNLFLQNLKNLGPYISR